MAGIIPPMPGWIKTSLVVGTLLVIAGEGHETTATVLGLVILACWLLLRRHDRAQQEKNASWDLHSSANATDPTPPGGDAYEP